jgi:pantoate--beta-alanine ligase
MLHIRSPQAMLRWSREHRCAGRTVGLVPTMGYLHEGHLRLLDRARVEADVTVVSVFVNPTQFGPGEDFLTYPRDPARDAELIAARGGDCIFAPETHDMYPSEPLVRVTPGELAAHLCGPSRPGHFEGVLTIVAKLFNTVEPDVAVFGRKDAQQARIISTMASELDFPVRVVVVPTVREPDRVAMSSRNSYLSSEERAAAAKIPLSLDAAHRQYESGNLDVESLLATVREVLEQSPLIEVEYVEVVEAERMAPVSLADHDTILAVAVRIGKARLIDNIALGEGLQRDHIVTV